MSNLEDVFLKINQEFAPDLFGDLKSIENSIDNKKPNEVLKYSIGGSDNTASYKTATKSALASDDST